MTSGGPGGANVITRPAPGRELSEDDRKKAAADAEKRLHEIQSQAPTMIEFKLFFSEWAEVDGVLFPHKIQRSAGGTADEEWTFSKVRVNPKIEPKKFQVRS
jgi:hypothetical protein